MDRDDPRREDPHRDVADEPDGPDEADEPDAADEPDEPDAADEPDASDAADDPAAAPGEELVALADGGRVLIRRLRPDDRDELAERYLQLSPATRRLRFFNAPEHLSERLLDYLVDLDHHDRSALVAVAVDDPGAPGIGIARYARLGDEPTCAEVAVTVLDGYQRRGIGTALVRRLAEDAQENGIDTFSASVMWENRSVLDGLREAGAEIHPSEPGVASVRLTLPERPREATNLRHALRLFAERVGQAIGIRLPS